MGKFLSGALIVLLILGIGFGTFGFFTVRRSFPQVSGEIRLPGLDGPVDVYRDRFGVPHIYATTEHDLFMAQGYIHAQDRFWQMDFWRHIGSGRLSEMFGESQLDADKVLRTLGWARVVQEELAQLDEKSLAILNDYSAGVNAYLADHQGSRLSLEYAILKLLNSGYRPEPWQPLHSLTWPKAMAWDLGGNMDEEIERALLLKHLTPEQVADLYPAYPADHPYVLPGFTLAEQPGRPSDERLAASSRPVSEALLNLKQQAAALDSILGPRGSGIGSNNWVISGKLTATGKPLLANDPHLGIQMPSIWYEVGLHCRPVSANCRVDVAGFSFASAPGVVIGHNARIAWGFTNVGPDVQDLYIEKINPDNPNQYEVNGRWVDMKLVEETIQVAGAEPVPFTVRYTRHGPIVSGNYIEEDLSKEGGIDLPEHYAISLRWTALEPTGTFPALWQMDLAQNWDEFRQATSQFDVPSQNLVYADLDGNIGYQTPGLIPIRAAGDGSLPVPGWTDEYEWVKYIPFEQMPHAFNPEKGYIATANNAVVDGHYPYMISQSWDLGYRAERIVELIENAPAPIDSAYIQTIQGDNKDLSAEFMMPLVMQLPLKEERLAQARALFEGWNYQADRDSAPAALYAAFWKNVLALTFNDDLPEDFRPEGGSRWFEIVRGLAQKPDSAWWDNRSTPQVETRDEILAQAFSQAVSEMEQLAGKNPQRWKWGDLHAATFRNQSLGKSGVAPIEALFNRGPYPTSGGDSIVDAVGWNAQKPFGVDWLPSMRMIVDLSNLQNSLTIHTTGQSGHAYHPHYDDMVELWRTIQYHPMLWEQSQVEAAAKDHLRLIP